MAEKQFDVIIIGAGAAGLTAALNLADRFKVAVLAKGEGAPADPVEAYKWTVLAARAGELVAQGNLPGFKARLSPEQLAEAERRAAAFQVKR